MIPNVPAGRPIPPKLWLRLTDIVEEYAASGEMFAEAGRPQNGPVAERFGTAETAYIAAIDAVWAAAWTQEQRDEWDRIMRLERACTCPTTCDCENPDGEGVAHCSAECPIHNLYPQPSPDCPLHNPAPRLGGRR